MPRDTDSKSAQLYRMVMPGHVCPYGLKSKDLLERQGFEVEDHPLDTREDTDAFMEKHGVETTPQTFIGDERIGGYDDLRVFFGHCQLICTRLNAACSAPVMRSSRVRSRSKDQRHRIGRGGTMWR